MAFRTRGSAGPRYARQDDSGFSLAEVIVALFILSGTFIALNVAIFGGMQASAVARQSQQASDLATQALETQRAVPENLFGAIAMRSTDLTGDSRVVSCTSSSTCISPGAGLAAEPLLLSSTGTVFPHLVTPDPTTRNGTRFSVGTYVTTPPTDSVGANYRRVTVFVSWTSYGKLHTRTQSTLITDSRRGLPLPRFRVVPTPTALCKNPGNTAVFTLGVQNLGARDSFDIYPEPTATTWSFYRDVDGDGAYTALVDTALTDTNSNGYGETGSIETSAAVPVLAVTAIPSTATASSVTYTFHGLSVGQPAATSALQSKTVQLTVQTAACGGGGSTPGPTSTPTTPVAPPAGCPVQSPVPSASPTSSQYQSLTYSLHNSSGTPAGDTRNDTVHTVSGTAATSPTLYDYSTNIETGVPGLQVASGGSASFTYTATKNMSLGGTATLAVWAQPRANGSSAAGGFTVTLTPYTKSGQTVTAGTPVTGSYTTTTWGCNAFRQQVVSLPLASVIDLKNGDYYVITLGVPSSIGSMLFAYDTTAYDQVFTVGVK